MTGHSTESPLLGNIPELDTACVKTYGKVATVLGELYRRYVVVIAAIAFHELLNVTSGGVPQVDIAIESHANEVGRRPVQKVQI